MDRRAGAALRWSRALVLTAVILAVGILGHTTAGGLLPGPSGLVAVALVCLVPTGLLLGGPASPVRIVALTAGGQAFVHAVLTLTAGHAGDAPRQVDVLPAPEARTASFFDQYAATRPQVVVTGPDPFEHLLADLAGHAPMMLAHLAAAIVVGLWLAAGERALWTALEAGLRAVVRLVVVHPPVLRTVRVAPVMPRTEPPPVRLVLLAPSVARRGPPALLPA